MYPGIAFQHIKVGKVTEMAQQYNRYVYFTLLCLHGFRGKGQRIFFLDINIFIIRNNAYHRDTTKFFKHLYSGFEQTDITTKFID